MKVLAILLLVVATCQARSIHGGGEDDVLALFKFIKELVSSTTTAAPTTVKITAAPTTTAPTTVKTTTASTTAAPTTVKVVTTTTAAPTTVKATTASTTTAPTTVKVITTTTTAAPTRPRRTTTDRVTGPTCIRNCIGLPDGNYQSCTRCDVYISCVGDTTIPDRPCPAGLVWDDRISACWTSSSTCTPI